MNRDRVVSMFRFYSEHESEQSTVQNEDLYINKAISDTEQDIIDKRRLSDVRLDYYAAALANIRYRVDAGMPTEYASRVYMDCKEMCKGLLKFTIGGL